MAKVRYIGQYDEVVVTDGQVEKVCTRGDVIEVSDTLAHGRDPVVDPTDPDLIRDGAVGGLLEQTDNWELVKDKPTSKAPTGQEGDDQ